jgi:hypothetical protein
MRTVCAVLVVAALACASAGAALGAATEIITVSSTGDQQVGESIRGFHSSRGILSADGRFVAFSSMATNLVTGDANDERTDVFVRDRRTGLTERVNVSSNGEQANSWSTLSAMTPDARFVLFSSVAPNLVPDDGNDSRDAFLRDRQEHTTEIVSLGASGQQGNSYSHAMHISPDGRFVVFSSEATNLVSGDTNELRDIFLRDREANTTELISVSSSGEQANWHSQTARVSADGRFVFFQSDASNLAPADTDDGSDVFVRDRLAGTTELVSISSSGEKGNDLSYLDSITPDGQFVVFSTAASNLTPSDTNEESDVFLRDRLAGTTELISRNEEGAPGDSESSDGHITPDARWVAFESSAGNLAPGDPPYPTGVFLRDRVGGTAERFDFNSLGEPLGDAVHPRLSDDARYVSFCTWEPGGVSWDTNGVYDTFVRDREGNPTFDDIPEIYWAFAEIEACAAEGVVQGYGGRRYQPKVTVTRAQMAVYIARTLAGGEDGVPDGPSSATFPDVPTDHWAFKHVEYVAAANIVKGYPTGLYGPTEVVDRGQMAVFVARSVVDPTGEDGLAGYTPPETPTFPDVGNTFWSYRHIEYCVEYAIVQGHDDGLYHHEWPVNREQMAVYVARAFGLGM